MTTLRNFLRKASQVKAVGNNIPTHPAGELEEFLHKICRN
jgi:hypothetical protein